MAYEFVVLFFLYMLEGIPYGLQSRFLPLVLRKNGVSLSALGLYKLLYIPWLFKSLYAPMVDTLSTKRRWLLGSLCGLFFTTFLLIGVPNILPAMSSSTDSYSSFPLCVCLFLYNFFAATQDIAVDGLALTILSTDQLAMGNTIQVVGYKLGAVFGGGFLTSLAAWFSVHQLLSLIALVYLSGCVLCMFSSVLDTYGKDIAFSATDRALTVNGSQQTDRSEAAPKSHGYFGTIKCSIFGTSGSRHLIILLLVYKLGEQGAMNMLPLMLLDRGFSMGVIGFWTGVIGQITSVAGSTAGYKYQLVHNNPIDSLIRLVAFRLVLQLPLLCISTHYAHVTNPSVCFVLSVLIMNCVLFVSGAISTVMFTLMMHCTRADAPPSMQATHYTFLSTAELIGKLLFGIVAASFTDLFGYGVSNIVFLFFSLLPVIYAVNRRTDLIFNPKML